jgi:SPP1 gp7 family putative phage head morphogenesis protein
LQKKYDTLALKVLSSASDNINAELEKTVKELIAGGAHVREAKLILAAKFDQLGLKPASKGQLETIFRTQTQIAFAAGKYKAENGYPIVEQYLWGYKYVTTGDDRVRPMHAALEGVTLPKGDPFWQRFYPPNGWNCRCQAIPLFEPYAIVRPPIYINGIPIHPDKGFEWSAGAIFNPMAV